MTAIPQSIERLKRHFAQQECWMVGPLAISMGYSVVSVRRFLRQVGYFRSYTHNGKWYTLASVPIFNRHGIWMHEDIAFSRHGDLIKTISSLLDKSPKGFSARELSEILHHPCLAVLTQLHKAQRVERVQGKHGFIYLSSNTAIRKRQQQALPLLRPTADRADLSAQVAVFVLVDYIHHPFWSQAKLIRELKKNHGIEIAHEAIDSFFAQHGLKKLPISKT